jgi:hypothetical protein
MSEIKLSFYIFVFKARVRQLYHKTDNKQTLGGLQKSHLLQTGIQFVSTGFIFLLYINKGYIDEQGHCPL